MNKYERSPAVQSATIGKNAAKFELDRHREKCQT